jgi:hypothetical protein
MHQRSVPGLSASEPYRYSGLALSPVSPSALSRDSIIGCLKATRFSHQSIWPVSESMIDRKIRCLLIPGDRVLIKSTANFYAIRRTGVLQNHLGKWIGCFILFLPYSTEAPKNSYSFVDEDQLALQF